MAVLIVLIVLLALVLAGWGLRSAMHRDPTGSGELWAEVEVGFHAIRRRVELGCLRFEMRQDAFRLRRELDRELRRDQR